MTKSEMREIAKEILMDSLAVAYYSLERDDYESLTEEEKNEIYEYISQYGTRMAKSIGKKYYTY